MLIVKEYYVYSLFRQALEIPPPHLHPPPQLSLKWHGLEKKVVSNQNIDHEVWVLLNSRNFEEKKTDNECTHHIIRSLSENLIFEGLKKTLGLIIIFWNSPEVKLEKIQNNHATNARAHHSFNTPFVATLFFIFSLNLILMWYISSRNFTS